MINFNENIEQEKIEPSYSAALIGAFKKVSAQRDGQMLLAWLLKISGYLSDISYNDPLPMAFNEGRRANGRTLYNVLLEHCPEQLEVIISQIIKEQIENVRKSNEQFDAEPDGGRERY